MLFIPNVGKLRFMQSIYDTLLGSELVTYRLYKNNKTPDAADVLADYFVCDFDGYGDLIGDAWSVGTISADHAIVDAATLQWLCTGSSTPNLVYGVVAYDSGSNTLLTVDRFLDGVGDPDPVSMAQVGDRINRRPILSLTMEL